MPLSLLVMKLVGHSRHPVKSGACGTRPLRPNYVHLSLGPARLRQQLGQLGNVRRNPPRLVAGQADTALRQRLCYDGLAWPVFTPVDWLRFQTGQLAPVAHGRRGIFVAAATPAAWRCCPRSAAPRH